MKSNAGLFAMLALAGMATSNHTNSSGSIFTSPEEEKRKRDQKQRRLLEEKGVREFVIDGVTVWARDQKNAERKAKNLTSRK